MFSCLWNSDWEKHAELEKPCDSTHLTETTEGMCWRKGRKFLLFPQKQQGKAALGPWGDVWSGIQMRGKEDPGQQFGMDVRDLCSSPSVAERALASVSQSITKIISTSSGKGSDLLDRKNSLIYWYYWLALNVPVCSANFHPAEMNEPTRITVRETWKGNDWGQRANRAPLFSSQHQQQDDSWQPKVKWTKAKGGSEKQQHKAVDL